MINIICHHSYQIVNKRLNFPFNRAFGWGAIRRKKATKETKQLSSYTEGKVFFKNFRLVPIKSQPSQFLRRRRFQQFYKKILPKGAWKNWTAAKR